MTFEHILAEVRGGAPSSHALITLNNPYVRRRFEVRELGIEQPRQGLGMLLRDGEDDGLAQQWFAQHALGVDVALVDHLALLAHDGAIPFEDREAPLQPAYFLPGSRGSRRCARRSRWLTMWKSAASR